MELLAAPAPVSEAWLLWGDTQPRSGTRRRNVGKGKLERPAPTKLPLSGWAKALTHTRHQLWAPLTPKWAFKAGHPSTEKWSPGISAPMPVPPGKSGKLKPHPLMCCRSIYGRKSADRTKPEFDVIFIGCFRTLFWWLRVVLWQKLKQCLKIYEWQSVYIPLFGPLLHQWPV